MKPLLLGLSLTANAMLLVAGAWLALEPRSPGRIATPPVEANRDVPKPASAGAVVQAVSPSTPKEVSTNGLWESPAGVQAWLASINAPLDVRYAIARAMLDQKYRAAFETARHPPDLKRWQRRHTPADPERENVVRRQQEEEYKQLFGPDLARARYGDDTVKKSGLAPESWLEINRIGRDYAQATRKLVLAGPMTPTERHLLNEEQNADLAKVLPPAEYEIYQAYYSPDGNRLQEAMKGLDIDDDAYLRAFQAMVAAKSPPPQTRSPVHVRPDEIRAIEQAVGAEVVAQITMNNDETFREVGTFLSAAKLPSGAMIEKHEAWTQYQQARRTWRVTSGSMDDSQQIQLRSYYDRLTAGLSDSARGEFDRTRAGASMLRLLNGK